MVPLPSELILPYAGFLVSDPSQLEPLTGSPWNFWIVVVVATIGNTLGSLVAYAIGAYGGRPFLERYGKYLLIRQHEIELADRFFARHGNATVFIGRLLPIVRTFISFPAGVARMPIGPFIVYSTAGAFLWSMLLVYAGPCSARTGRTSAHALQPFDLLIAVAVVGRRRVRVVAARHARPARPRFARTRRRPGPPRPASALGAEVLLGRAHVPELAVEQQVVDDLAAAGQVERQRDIARVGHQDRRERRRDRRAGRPGDPGHAGRRGALVGVDHRDHVRLPRRDVHLAQARTEGAGR